MLLLAKYFLHVLTFILSYKIKESFHCSEVLFSPFYENRTGSCKFNVAKAKKTKIVVDVLWTKGSKPK